MSTHAVASHLIDTRRACSPAVHEYSCGDLTPRTANFNSSRSHLARSFRLVRCGFASGPRLSHPIWFRCFGRAGFRFWPAVAAVRRAWCRSRRSRRPWRVRGQGDDRDRTGVGRGFQAARGFPAVHDGQAHVHQNQVGRFAGRAHDAAQSVDRQNHLVAAPLQTPRQHIAIRFVVFHQKNFCHRRFRARKYMT